MRGRQDRRGAKAPQGRVRRPGYGGGQDHIHVGGGTPEKGRGQRGSRGFPEDQQAGAFREGGQKVTRMLAFTMWTAMITHATAWATQEHRVLGASK